MQKNFTVVMLLAVIISVGATTGLAFAQETEPNPQDVEEVILGLELGQAAAAAGTGGVAGIVLSTVRAVGKRLRNAKEKVDPKKLGFNILVGAVTGTVLTLLGVPIDATIAGNFLALYVVNQFRPLVSNWITGKQQTKD